MNEQKKNMRVLDALKESDKVEGQLIGSYAIVIEGVLHWVDKATDKVQRPVVIADIGRDEWRPYPNKKELLPERAGEVWITEGGNSLVTYLDGDKLSFCNKFGISGHIKDANMIGWKLIYSPDEEVMKELEGEKV